MTGWGSVEERLTAIWVSPVIVGNIDGASIELSLGCDIRNATRDRVPHCLTRRIVRKQRRGRPYRREVVNVRARGRIVIWGTCTGSTLGSRGSLGEDRRRSKGSKGNDQLKRARLENEHGSDTGRKRSGVLCQ
jgi:hypothetical protein